MLEPRARLRVLDRLVLRLPRESPVSARQPLVLRRATLRSEIGE